MDVEELAALVEMRAVEYVYAALRENPWDLEEQEKFWTADSLFRIADRLRARASLQDKGQGHE